MVRTSVYHDLQGSLSQNDAIYLQSNRVAKIVKSVSYPTEPIKYTGLYPITVWND